MDTDLVSQSTIDALKALPPMAPEGITRPEQSRAFTALQGAYACLTLAEDCLSLDACDVAEKGGAFDRRYAEQAERLRTDVLRLLNRVEGKQ